MKTSLQKIICKKIQVLVDFIILINLKLYTESSSGLYLIILSHHLVSIIKKLRKRKLSLLDVDNGIFELKNKLTKNNFDQCSIVYETLPNNYFKNLLNPFKEKDLLFKMIQLLLRDARILFLSSLENNHVFIKRLPDFNKMKGSITKKIKEEKKKKELEKETILKENEKSNENEDYYFNLIKKNLITFEKKIETKRRKIDEEQNIKINNSKKKILKNKLLNINIEETIPKNFEEINYINEFKIEKLNPKEEKIFSLIYEKGKHMEKDFSFYVENFDKNKFGLKLGSAVEVFITNSIIEDEVFDFLNYNKNNETFDNIFKKI